MQEPPPSDSLTCQGTVLHAHFYTPHITNPTFMTVLLGITPFSNSSHKLLLLGFESFCVYLMCKSRSGMKCKPVPNRLIFTLSLAVKHATVNTGSDQQVNYAYGPGYRVRTIRPMQLEI